MSLWQSYTSLPPRTKLYLGLGLITWSSIGLWVTSTAEQKLGMQASEEDLKKLKEVVPKVRWVDKDE